MKTKCTLFSFLIAIASFAIAGETAGRKMCWAHYVPWHPAENNAFAAIKYLNSPYSDVSTDVLKDEVAFACEHGIDGFFMDVCAKKGFTTFGDLTKFLKAAEGTDFQVGLCLDVKTTVSNQISELRKLLELNGKHPNYPKWNGRYVVATYTWAAWQPEEWMEIRKGVEAAGYPLYLVANFDGGYKKFTETKYEEYAKVFDRAYSFLAPGFTGIRADEFHTRSFNVCNKLGKVYMPTLWPAYYGAWNGGRNDFYQPYCGVDMIHENFLGAKKTFTDWLHVTTWNDHDETTLMARRLSPAVKQLVRAYSDELKGVRTSNAQSDFIFAYHREVFPGTVWRIEAMRMPSLDKSPVKLQCRLLNAAGREVKRLPVLDFAGEAWERKEWIVDTSTLASNAEVRPEMIMASASVSRRAAFPSMFLVSPYLHNPETVRVTFSGSPKITKCDFTADWTNGVLSASLDFECDREVKRAILFADDLPMAQFYPDRDSAKRLIHILVRGAGSFTMKTDASILTAARQFNPGKRRFSWTEKTCNSWQQVNWEPVSMEILGDGDSSIEIKCGKDILKTTIDELAEKKSLKLGKFTISTGANASIYQHRPFATKAASAKLSLATAKPDPWSRWWVQIECADGTTAESAIIHLGMKDRKTVVSKMLRTPYNLDTKSGASGIPKMREFLTPVDEMPILKEEIVTGEMDTRIFRGFVWTNHENVASFRLPLRRWPSGSYEIKFAFTPKVVEKGKKASPIKVVGKMDGVRVNLLDDGRLEVIRVSGVKNEGGVKETLISKSPIVFGVRHEIKIVSAFDKLTLFIDGEEDSFIPLTPQIRYGNLTTTLNGVDSLEFRGLAIK